MNERCPLCTDDRNIGDTQIKIAPDIWVHQRCRQVVTLLAVTEALIKQRQGSEPQSGPRSTPTSLPNRRRHY